MGFLNQLFGKEVRKVISDVVDTVVDDALKNAFGKTGNQSGAGSGTVQSETDVEEENLAATGREESSGEELLGKRIEEIAARDLPGFELRKQVPSSEVDAPEGAESYFEYGFYRDGKLVAVVKFLWDNNAYCRKSVRLAQQACRDKQVTYLNFMSYMTNRPEYIAERLKKNIR